MHEPNNHHTHLKRLLCSLFIFRINQLLHNHIHRSFTLYTIFVADALCAKVIFIFTNWAFTEQWTCNHAVCKNLVRAHLHRCPVLVYNAYMHCVCRYAYVACLPIVYSVLAFNKLCSITHTVYVVQATGTFLYTDIFRIVVRLLLLLFQV